MSENEIINVDCIILRLITIQTAAFLQIPRIARFSRDSLVKS